MFMFLFGIFGILSMIFCIGVDVLGIIKKQDTKVCCIRLIVDVIVLGAWSYFMYLYIR